MATESQHLIFNCYVFKFHQHVALDHWGTYCHNTRSQNLGIAKIGLKKKEGVCRTFRLWLPKKGRCLQDNRGGPTPWDPWLSLLQSGDERREEISSSSLLSSSSLSSSSSSSSLSSPPLPSSFIDGDGIGCEFDDHDIVDDIAANDDDDEMFPLGWWLWRAIRGSDAKIKSSGKAEHYKLSELGGRGVNMGIDYFCWISTISNFYSICGFLQLEDMLPIAWT